jgi:hypothetical protein
MSRFVPRPFQLCYRVHFSQPTDDPILLEDSICTSEDSGQNVSWEAGHTAAGREDDVNELMSNRSDNALPVHLDIDNPETGDDHLSAKDPNGAPLHEHNISCCSTTSPHVIIMPTCGGPPKAQEGSPELNRENNDDTIIVEIATSDCGNESSDDSDDGDYVEECPRPTKRLRRVRFSETVRYRSQEAPMSPADTLDSESQGRAESSSDTVYASEIIPIRGVLTLKEVNSEMQYCLTFSQDLLPRFFGQKQNDTSCTLTSAHSVRSASPSEQGRGRAGCGRYSFSVEDDQRLKRLKEEGLPWNEIAKHFPRSTKGSLQVHYSTKLKDRLENANKSKKRQRSG